MQQSYLTQNFKISGKILLLVSGMCMYLQFMMYGADLTTRMTAGSGLHPVKNFNDVIKCDYKVIVKEATGQFEELKNAIPGTPKHTVYLDQIKGNPNGIVKGLSDAIEMMNEDGRTLFFYTLTARFITDELKFISTQGSEIQDQL